METLLVPREVDRLLRYPRGRALRLARQGVIAAILLPDGEIRFEQATIEALLKRQPPPIAEPVAAGGGQQNG